MTSASPLSFTLPQRIIHWGMALLIFYNLLFTDGMNRLMHVLRNGETPTTEQISSASVHAYIGLAILALAVFRLRFRFAHGAPAEPEDEPPLFKLAAKIAHATFYGLFFALPLTGIAKYYLGLDPAGFVHGGLLKTLMWVLIVAHIAATLVHRFYWKTDVASRMTRG